VTPGTLEERLKALRVVCAALGSGPVLLTIPALLIDVDAVVSFLFTPAVLVGMVSPAVAWRVYDSGLRRAEACADTDSRWRAFERATVLALVQTEAVAILSLVAYVLTRAELVLIGVATHVAIAGAVWPSRSRVEASVGGSGA
jgi:hypothetical protein